MAPRTNRRDAIRASREVEVVSRKPWRLRVLSTSGTYHHDLWWSALLSDVICDTCRGRHGQTRCWARAKALAFLRAEMTARREAAPA
jgi:hypothetical protein